MSAVITVSQSTDPEAGLGGQERQGPSAPDIEERPWKFLGYKDLASYMASDSMNFVARRFDRLHTRAILTLQARLEQAEEELDAMDHEFSLENVKAVGAEPPLIVKGPFSPEKLTELAAAHGEFGVPRDINNGTVRDDMPERIQLISEIIVKLKDYDRLLLDFSQLHLLPPASDFNIKNTQDWFIHNDGVIMADEQNFSHETQELVCFCKPKSALRQLLERQMINASDDGNSSRLFRFFRKDVPKMSAHDRNATNNYDDALLDRFTFFTMLVAVLIMLIVPLWVLQALTNIHHKLGVITAFSVTWLGILSYGVHGKVFEKLAGIAGYVAILVVFLQIGNETDGANITGSEGKI